ncbi:glycine/betaine ABC transporter substrate-binding protein [Alicyclobacillus ferrooxydans]|uniref:Glycine/betaine ABC transporter substrate-binding protein n=1 Tax=Alicyclobacillus ferrooxydans TaxID=471514 RepID=A0A0N8PNP2_9BACL|nr:glycine/betaine ABC transporter substrate-binding protein [Alicyclobacillus ferrooxydans]
MALTAGVAGCGSAGSANNTIVIGGKNFTEQLIMSNILKQLIQHDDPKLTVKMKDNLDSNVAWEAMKSKDVDVYVEYTGTGLVNILKDPVTTDPNKAYNEVKAQFQSKYHITWLKPIGFNDTYAMVMQKSEANKLGITDISQLAKQSGNLVLGTEQDFVTRNDALPAMNKLYGTHFKAVKPMEIGLKYEALISNKVDVIDGFSTDPQIPEYNLVVLKDNKHLFPPYYAAPIIQDSTLKAHPELKGILNKLAGKIDDAEMQKLNEEVDQQKMTPAQVAKQWLTQQGLLS